MDLLTETRNLLKETSIPFTVIAQNCGVTDRYLRYMLSGERANPGVKGVQKVFNFLSSSMSNNTTQCSPSSETEQEINQGEAA